MLCLAKDPTAAAAAATSSSSMDDLLSLAASKKKKRHSNIQKYENDNSDESDDLLFDDVLGNIPIPTTGISVSDELEAMMTTEKFVTELVPMIMDEGTEKYSGVAMILTRPSCSDSFEPQRYLIALTQPKSSPTANATDESTAVTTSYTTTDYVLVDIPPYSDALLQDMKSFMGEHGRLVAMIITSRDGIHYDDAPAVYTTRRADLDQWKKAFDGEGVPIAIVGYRIDVPRDCRMMVTQILDGYGPFAWDENNRTFVETGRPLTIDTWDFDVSQDILTGKAVPPDDDQIPPEQHQDDLYSPESIRKKEENKQLLAIYTPGHTFGSLSFVFPERKICCSGYTVPVEDPRTSENDQDDMDVRSQGPVLDCRGYITTSRAGLSKQMQSARFLVDTYADRFDVILPSQGEPWFLPDLPMRQEVLRETLRQYQRIGDIYGQLGITSSDD
jgi:glyoxylase-like metal-dependent hydrolase (beta-lactamase superfamily II)